MSTPTPLAGAAAPQEIRLRPCQEEHIGYIRGKDGRLYEAVYIASVSSQPISTNRKLETLELVKTVFTKIEQEGLLSQRPIRDIKIQKERVQVDDQEVNLIARLSPEAKQTYQGAAQNIENATYEKITRTIFEIMQGNPNPGASEDEDDDDGLSAATTSSTPREEPLYEADFEAALEAKFKQSHHLTIPGTRRDPANRQSRSPSPRPATPLSPSPSARAAAGSRAPSHSPPARTRSGSTDSSRLMSLPPRAGSAPSSPLPLPSQGTHTPTRGRSAFSRSLGRGGGASSDGSLRGAGSALGGRRSSASLSSSSASSALPAVRPSRDQREEECKQLAKKIDSDIVYRLTVLIQGKKNDDLIDLSTHFQEPSLTAFKKYAAIKSIPINQDHSIRVDHLVKLLKLLTDES